MIQSNELRIGNYVMSAKYRSNKLHFTRVETLKHGWTDTGYKLVLNKEGVATCEEFGADLEKEVMPIALTSEWLLKFGFEYSEYIDYEQKERSYSKNGIEIYLIGCSFQLLDYDLRIEHVHQLQNLYFALTGEELEIK